MAMNKLIILSIVFCFASVTQGSAKKKQTIIAKNAVPEKISEEFSFTEGPAVDSNGNIYFTDQPNNKILKWSTDGSITTFMENCGRSNGLYFDNDGKLLACADENNQLWSIDINSKERQVLINDFNGMQLNGPNDLWVAPNGGIFFTDPYYRRRYWADSNKKASTQCVYYLTPDRMSVFIIDSTLTQPNGIIGTPDGKRLYVADIGGSKTYTYKINLDGTLSEKKLFCEMGSDGMTMDNKGNVYLTGNGVTVFNANGEIIEEIPISERWTANVTFGGKKRNMLFITASQAVYTLKMKVKGNR